MEGIERKSYSAAVIEVTKVEEVTGEAATAEDDADDDDQNVEQPVPQTKVKELIGRAMSAQDEDAEDQEDDAEDDDDNEISTRALAGASDGSVVENVVVSGTLKKLIRNLHRELRATVLPPATDMKKMKWSNAVAQYAANWAQCGEHFFKHRRGENKIESYGENLYLSMSSGTDTVDLKEAIKYGLNAWWKEKKDYNFDSNSCKAGKQCGHYKQMAWANSNVVGCGYALNCPIEGKPQYTSSFYLVCNYSPPGNYIGKQPYTAKDASAIWTFGGTGIGANCLFPFTHEGTTYDQCIEVYPGEMPWCKTDNGKWGYCAPEQLLSESPCMDKSKSCPRKMAKMEGKCPTDTHYSNKLRMMKKRCAATCDYCTCAVQECQNGGTLEKRQCACKCAGGWTGGDCAACPMSECKNGGTFDAVTCSCTCPTGYGSADCGCGDNPEPFQNHDKTFKCSAGWIVTNRLCTCPKWGPALKENCPLTCNTCPIPGTEGRE
ncbi:Cysteine-rich secretory protein 3 [Lamellibrachia satsuma]|nr:Cysteine-rich secretory protein 3 [Lamellibrachia satsuma]